MSSVMRVPPPLADADLNSRLAGPVGRFQIGRRVPERDQTGMVAEGQSSSSDDLEKDLRLAAEIGTGLLARNEELERALADAQEREASALATCDDLRRRIAISEDEILALSADVMQLSKPDPRLKEAAARIRQLENALRDAKQVADENDDAVVNQHTGGGESDDHYTAAGLGPISRRNALSELKSFARERQLERELAERQRSLAETRMALEDARTQTAGLSGTVANLTAANARLRETVEALEEELAKRGEQRSRASSATTLLEEMTKNDEPASIGNDRNGGNVLVEFFFLTAMACKLELVRQGLSSEVYTITNEQLYDDMVREQQPVPFCYYHYWIKARLTQTLRMRDQQAKSETSIWHALWNWI
ncbi:RH2 domain-containing protein [Plasmodiophora brassicae]|uniref:Uncharacterized protein n=1 Tax=Plasmodiophora brassicae TaxID=37360 RepID=A0A3P3Y772_PLABS|nr:unnamed protein product [Plasmodiophora brassicae]